MKKRWKKPTNEELLRTARGFMKGAERHHKMVELTGTTPYKPQSSLLDAEKAIDSKRLTWGKN